jgi:uncharacterized membrane protein
MVMLLNPVSVGIFLLLEILYMLQTVVVVVVAAAAIKISIILFSGRTYCFSMVSVKHNSKVLLHHDVLFNF